MVAKVVVVVVVFVAMAAVLLSGDSVTGMRQRIRSTKPKPAVKKYVASAVIPRTSPVLFKSISISERRPSIQVVKKQHKRSRTLTLSFYDYKTRPPLWWHIPQHPMDCGYLLYKETKYCIKVEELLRANTSISWMNKRGDPFYF
jgi:hypothetical protein